ncbi:hypothetical protein EBB59_04695 [Lysobacter pythonis]|uniref:Secreted protein n=1 Tax=Solilutibacter pythonis TaxID=2483112 RepID=A0A3M2HZI2_9GAMM|nr:hypothetical protein [Lysobacter pythonis]RMH93545.1 hypothetical protein EBB59_04695 [Lysobacter pythonis]
MSRFLFALPLIFVAGWAQASAPNCAGVPQVLPTPPGIGTSVSPELQASTTDLGAPSGVLSQSYDQALSVDQVLLRMRIEACRVATVLPAPGPIDPNDPAAYKPKTEFDNTPWRFDMSQGGKRMTADEFDAWMKARGVRIATGRPAVRPSASAPTPEAVQQPDTENEKKSD